MSTQAANYGASQLQPKQAAGADRPFNMRERKEPTFVTFADGDFVEGVLVNVERIEVGEPKKMANRYTVADLDTRELSSFLGSYQIDTKLRPSDKGHFIQVRCEGEDKTVVRSGRAMKKFRVVVSDEAVPAAKTGNQLEDGTFITDYDIGF